jgi:hypothetical protein
MFLMASDKVETLKSEITKIIGPIGKFIIEKQIKAMGYEEDSFPQDKMPELIDRVVDIGVYDKQMSKSIKQRLREATGG